MFFTTVGYLVVVSTAVTLDPSETVSFEDGSRETTRGLRQTSWRDQHPQTRARIFTSANVHDPAPPFEPAYRLQCHSCMSAYLEHQFVYISHLYRKPLAFTEKCDQNNFDWRYMRTKNCTDLCVTLRMNDKVGGRRRFGFMRGCMSDIIHYNRSVIRGSMDSDVCYLVRLRDLFVTSERYSFDSADHVEMCTCQKPMCNAATSISAGMLGNLLPLTLALSAFAYLRGGLSIDFDLSAHIVRVSNRRPRRRRLFSDSRDIPDE